MTPISATPISAETSTVAEITAPVGSYATLAEHQLIEGRRRLLQPGTGKGGGAGPHERGGPARGAAGADHLPSALMRPAGRAADDPGALAQFVDGAGQDHPPGAQHDEESADAPQPGPDRGGGTPA